MLPKCFIRALSVNYSNSSCLNRRILKMNLFNPSRFRNSPLIIHRNASQSAEATKKTSNNNFHRHCFHDECEKLLNEQIEAELNACYTYLAMASHFGRSEVALPGCYAFFFQMHLEELGHAHNLIRYQNMRGGKVLFCGLKTVEDCKWNVQQSLEKGLQMEKEVKEVKLIRGTNCRIKSTNFIVETDCCYSCRRKTQRFLLVRLYNCGLHPGAREVNTRICASSTTLPVDVGLWKLSMH